MADFYYLYLVVLLLAAALASFAIWSPRRALVRGAALLVALTLIPVLYIHAMTMLSRPKPLEFAWFERDVEQAVVLATNFEEGKAIYLWLRFEGEREPRYFKLPWRQSAAERLEDVQEAATRTGGRVVLNAPLSMNGYLEYGELNAAVQPPPANPSKPPPEIPDIVDPRDENI